MQKLLTFFSKNSSIHTVFTDQRFNDILTNDTISFEQLGPDKQCRPRSDATERGIWSGSPLFANSLAIILQEYLNLIAGRT